MILTLCLLYLGALPLTQRRVRWIDLPPFERAVLCVKHFEGWHGKEHHLYVGYGHDLKKGEKFTAEMTERQADSLLRADLWERFEVFKGYGKQGKSRLLRKNRFIVYSIRLYNYK